MFQLETFLKKVEELIRMGKFTEATKLMNSVPRSNLQPSQVLKLAQFLRRSDQSNLALLLLRPYIDFKSVMNPQLFPDIQIEYAACLIKRGIITPAMHILDKLDPGNFPRIHLFMAFGLFAEWNYEAAIPLLTQYCNSKFISAYERAVGQVNLAAAYLGCGQSQPAKKLLTTLIPYLKDQTHLLLMGNCYELMAQVYLQEERYDQAKIAIDESEKIFGPEKSRYRLALTKWKLILLSKQNEFDQSRTVTEFTLLREQANERNDFEIMRDSELWLACLLKDKNLLKKVYFGSAFEGYRKNILKHFPEKMELPEFYLYQLRKSTNGPVVDFFGPMKISGITKGVCQLLCSDFYRPFSVGRIFNHLFPLELFDPIQDAHRIHEIVRRTNIWLNSQKIPLRIDSSNYGYKFMPVRPCRILVPIDAAVKAESFERALLRHSNKETFSAKQACQWTKTPLVTTIRKINGLISSGYLLKVNSGRKTMYAWNSGGQASANLSTKAS